ncbi:hypothetical protein FSP39_006034 [Pinctada imbricata]|uniref:Uncharacterized protein n=1 Tax=Pinctada imbricata TaxID=66713 RepID=A0AA89C4N1_PINIB|nr:hypothetical protein FSP39_006034 [Pinctada imbricata]
MTPLVPLWNGKEINNQFVYYVTGGLGLIYLVALFFAFVSTRTKSSIVVLPPVEKFEDERVLHKYVLVIDTSCNLGIGSSLCKRASICIQLMGTKHHSKLYKLHAMQGGQLLLQRGNKNIFIFKTKDYLGDILKVKLVISGDYTNKWIPVRTRVIRLATGARWDVPIEVIHLGTDTTEPVTYQYSTALNCCGTTVHHFLSYHTWFSPLVSDTRFGAYTNTINSIVLFFGISVLFMGSMLVYIFVPQDLSDVFYLEQEQLIYSLYVALALGSAVGLFKLTIYQCKSGSKKKVMTYQELCQKHEMVTETVSKPKISVRDLTSKSGEYIKKSVTGASARRGSKQSYAQVKQPSMISEKTERRSLRWDDSQSIIKDKQSEVILQNLELGQNLSLVADKSGNAGGNKKDARNLNQEITMCSGDAEFSESDTVSYSTNYYNQEERLPCKKYSTKGSKQRGVGVEMEKNKKRTFTRESENLPKFCREILFAISELLQEVRVDIMEGRFYKCVRRTEDQVNGICRRLEEGVKAQAEYKRKMSSSSLEGSQIPHQPEELLVIEDSPLLFWCGSIKILNQLLDSVPQSYRWKFRERDKCTSYLVNKAKDLVMNFDESQFQTESLHNTSEYNREEVIIDDHVSIIIEETEDFTEIRKTMALVLQISINHAFMQMFGEEMVVPLSSVQDSISTDDTEDLLQSLFDGRTAMIRTVANLCRSVIEQATAELIEDFQDPVYVYIQFLVRQAMLSVLSHIKHMTVPEGKYGTVLDELINDLNKKWQKEGFSQSQHIDKNLAQLLLSTHLQKLMEQEVELNNELYEFLQNMTALKRLEIDICKELNRLAYQCIGVPVRKGGKLGNLSLADIVPADRGDIDAVEFINTKTDIGIISIQTPLSHLACSIINEEAILLGAQNLCNDAVNSALLELQVDLQTLQYERSGGPVRLQETEVDILKQDIKNMHAYLHLMKAVEQMQRVHSIKTAFIEKNKKKHKEFATVNLQNVLDSYNTVDADSFDKSLNNKMLFELEWDLTNENQKPLPHFLKGILGFLMVCGTVVCLWYTGQTGGQLSITEVQEWAACYLISLLCYGLFVDSIFAVIIGLSQLKYK